MLHASDIHQLCDSAQKSLLALPLALAVTVAMVLGALTLMVNRFTAFRRAVRKARITQRLEGWGAPCADDDRAAEPPSAEQQSGNAGQPSQDVHRRASATREDRVTYTSDFH